MRKIWGNKESLRLRCKLSLLLKDMVVQKVTKSTAKESLTTRCSPKGCVVTRKALTTPADFL